MTITLHGTEEQQPIFTTQPGIQVWKAISLPQSVRFHPLKPNLLVDPGSVHGLRLFSTQQYKTQSSII